MHVYILSYKPFKQMTCVYALISAFKDKLIVHNVSKNVQSLTRHMKNLAVEYVQDCIGKNNYIDTLSEKYINLPIKNCPSGYVLKISEPSDSTPKLTVYLHKVTSGYIHGNYHDITSVGYYIILPINELDSNIHVSNRTSTVVCADTRVDAKVQQAWGNLGPDLINKIKLRETAKTEETKKIINDTIVNVATTTNDTSTTAESSNVSADTDNVTITTANDHQTANADDSEAQFNGFKKELLTRALEFQARLDQQIN